MPTPNQQAATNLLSSCASNPDSPERLFEVLYDELRVMARGYLNREGPGHSLHSAELVNELYLKLIDGTQVTANDRAHFFALSARAMRQVLVSHARAKSAGKRGGSRDRVPLQSDMTGTRVLFHDLLDLDQALERLQEQDERLARVVEMRFFSGMSVEEIASALGVSTRTVVQHWSFARAWLNRELTRGAASDAT